MAPGSLPHTIPTVADRLPPILIRTATATAVVMAPVALALSILLLATAMLGEAVEPTPRKNALAWLGGILVIGVATLMHLATRRLLGAPAEFAHVPLRRTASTWMVRLAPTAVMIAGLVVTTSRGNGWPLWVFGAVALVMLWRREQLPNPILQATETPPQNDQITHPLANSISSSDSVVAEQSDELQGVDGHGTDPVVGDLAGDLTGEPADNGLGLGDEDGAGGALRQRVEHRVLDDGSQVIQMWQFVELPAWERYATLHFPFWPTLPVPPEVTGEALAEVQASLSVEQVECHGCRLRLELEESDERPQVVEVNVVAML